VEEIMHKIIKLLSVKSLVTLTLTVVFAVLAVAGKVSQDFMTIYAVIISFYFGTQHERSGEASV
jgi:hypothetical protein